jgi:hypothetical protein
MPQVVIVAPHPDDEIIGLFEILETSSPIIIYSGDLEESRRQTVLKLKDTISIKAQIFLNTIPSTFINKEHIIYVPDPIYEIHPKHRYWGVIGESIARAGFDVIFYSIMMNAPYIHEVKESKKKEELLTKVYPDQKSLWEYEKKYILFEGRCQWLFK